MEEQPSESSARRSAMFKKRYNGVALTTDSPPPTPASRPTARSIGRPARLFPTRGGKSAFVSKAGRLAQV